MKPSDLDPPSADESAVARATDTRDSRAKDLLTADPTTRAALTATLDPLVRAELDRWFGAPTGQPEVVDETAAEMAAVAARQAAAAAHADPAFVAHIERWERASQALTFEDTTTAHTMARYSQTLPAARMLQETNIAAPRLREIPWELTEDLAVNVPQALLRDLHRYVEFFAKAFYTEQTRDEAVRAPHRVQFAPHASHQLESAAARLRAASQAPRAARAFPWGQASMKTEEPE